MKIQNIPIGRWKLRLQLIERDPDAARRLDGSADLERESRIGECDHRSTRRFFASATGPAIRDRLIYLRPFLILHKIDHYREDRT